MTYIKRIKINYLSLVLFMLLSFSNGLSAQQAPVDRGGVLDNINTEGKNTDEFFNKKMEKVGVADLKDFFESDEQKSAKADRLMKEMDLEDRLKDRAQKNGGKAPTPKLKKTGRKKVGKTIPKTRDKKLSDAKRKTGSKVSSSSKKKTTNSKSKINTKSTGTKTKKIIKKNSGGKTGLSKTKKTTKPKATRKPRKKIRRNR